MKFLIDADLPRSLKEVFKKHKCDAVDIRDTDLFSAEDKTIFEYAKDNKYILVTRDVGFAGMFAKKKGFGLVLARLPFYFTVDKINKVFDKFLKNVDVKNLSNTITVVELDRYRIRKL